MSSKVRKQSLVGTCLGSDSPSAKKLKFCSCTKVRGTCMLNQSIKYPMWIQKGWQAPEELDISSLLSISEGWFLSVSSAKHWTKLITHSRMPQFQSINSFFFNLLLCQVLTCLAHSLQNAALPPSLFLLSKLKLPP